MSLPIASGFWMRMRSNGWILYEVDCFLNFNRDLVTVAMVTEDSTLTGCGDASVISKLV